MRLEPPGAGASPEAPPEDERSQRIAAASAGWSRRAGLTEALWPAPVRGGQGRPAPPAKRPPTRP